ncbi:MAG: CehA/McbA family metallohydrolase [Anaerolineales bacterium]
MHEITLNIHMHTIYSDGFGTHDEIAKAAISSGIDAVIVTDHNVLVNGIEGYYGSDNRRVLMLVGEEIHDQTRDPQKDHLLVIGIKREMATFAPDTQHLVDMIRNENGISFIAHPHDPASAAFNETDITWENWDIKGFTGIEIWNAMSEFKSRLKSKIHGLYYAFNPDRVATCPDPRTLKKWDELLIEGKRVVGIGGTDAHAIPASIGPLQRILFPYEYHFKTINTHLYLPHPLLGDYESDRKMILSALSNGRCFIGYDLPRHTKGFRFFAHGMERTAWMGEEISARRGVTFQVCLPHVAECNLIKDGEVFKKWNNRENYTYITNDPGIYRVEAFIKYLGKRRGWIYSNPIYVRN